MISARTKSVAYHAEKSDVKELVQDAMLTLFMTKEKQGWTIAAFQNTAVTAPPGR